MLIRYSASVGPGVEVGPAVRLLEREPVRDEGDVVGVVRTEEGVDVGVVHRRVVEEQWRLAVARGPREGGHQADDRVGPADPAHGDARSGAPSCRPAAGRTGHGTLPPRRTAGPWTGRRSFGRGRSRSRCDGEEVPGSPLRAGRNLGARSSGAKRGRAVPGGTRPVRYLLSATEDGGRPNASPTRYVGPSVRTCRWSAEMAISAPGQRTKGSWPVSLTIGRPAASHSPIPPPTLTAS